MKYIRLYDKADKNIPNEVIVCEIKIRGGEKLLFAAFYRSPNSSDENSKHVNEFIVELSKLRHKYMCFLGDFNYPMIDWESWTVRGGGISGDSSQCFIESLRGAFLHQHITEPTRARG